MRLSQNWFPLIIVALIFSTLIASIAMVGLYNQQHGERSAILLDGNEEVMLQLKRASKLEHQAKDNPVHIPNNHPSNLPLKEYIAYYKQRMNSSAQNKPSRIIWQTWVRNKLPDKVENYWQNIIRNNPEYTRRTLNDTQIEEYVSQNCPGPYSDIFHSINPDLGAMKADLWRYCVLYNDGGIYMDVDSGMPSNMPMNQWIDHNVVLSMEGNRFEGTHKMCSSIWSAANATMPKKIMISNSLVQWAMIFPLAHHPILKEAMDIAIRLLTAWDDGKSKRWATQHRVVCLSGPAVFSVAAHNAYMAAGGSWEGLSVTMDGIDYEKKLLYKSPVRQELYEEKKHYRSVSRVTPIKMKGVGAGK